MDPTERPKPWSRRAALGAILAAAVGGRCMAASAQSGTPAFVLGPRDIAEIYDLGERLHIKLREHARARFAAFTGANIGRLARVTAGGTVLIEAQVRAQIDSGLLSSQPLDQGTREDVRKLLTGQ